MKVTPKKESNVGSNRPKEVGKIDAKYYSQIKQAVLHCLNPIQQKHLSKLLSHWQKSIQRKPSETIINIFETQKQLIDKKRNRQFSDTIAPLSAMCLMYLECGEITRSFLTGLEVGDIVVAKGERLLGEELIFNFLKIFQYLDARNAKSIISSVGSIAVIWLIAVPLSFANFKETLRQLRRIMKPFSETIRRRVRTTDGYQIAKIWLTSIRNNDQNLLNRLDDLPALKPNEEISNLADQLNRWVGQYFIIREANDLLKLV